MKKALTTIALAALCAVTALTLSSCASNGGAQKVKVIEVDLTEEEYAFAVAKDNQDMLSKLNAYIEKIRTDGTFDNICSNYFSGGTPKEVRTESYDPSKDQLVVVTNAEFAPFEYKNGEAFVGIDMEIAEGFARSLGKELVIKDVEFEDVCPSIEKKEGDVAMAALTVTDERKSIVAFSDSYYEASQRIITKSSDTTFDSVKKAADAIKILGSFDKSVAAGCAEGTTGEAFIKGSEELGFSGIPCTCKSYPDVSEALDEMLKGNSGFVIVDAACAETMAKKLNSN